MVGHRVANHFEYIRNSLSRHGSASSRAMRGLGVCVERICGRVTAPRWVAGSVFDDAVCGVMGYRSLTRRRRAVTTILDILVLLFGAKIALWGLACALAPVATERVIVTLFKAVVDALGLA